MQVHHRLQRKPIVQSKAGQDKSLADAPKEYLPAAPEDSVAKGPSFIEQMAPKVAAVGTAVLLSVPMVQTLAQSSLDFGLTAALGVAGASLIAYVSTSAAEMTQAVIDHSHCNYEGALSTPRQQDYPQGSCPISHHNSTHADSYGLLFPNPVTKAAINAGIPLLERGLAKFGIHPIDKS